MSVSQGLARGWEFSGRASKREFFCFLAGRTALTGRVGGEGVTSRVVLIPALEGFLAFFAE
jgi:hypothetical protein